MSMAKLWSLPIVDIALLVLLRLQTMVPQVWLPAQQIVSHKHAMPINLVTNVWRIHQFKERKNGITVLSEQQRSVATDNQSRFLQ